MVFGGNLILPAGKVFGGWGGIKCVWLKTMEAWVLEIFKVLI